MLAFFHLRDCTSRNFRKPSLHLFSFCQNDCSIMLSDCWYLFVTLSFQFSSNVNKQHSWIYSPRMWISWCHHRCQVYINCSVSRERSLGNLSLKIRWMPPGNLVFNKYGQNMNKRLCRKVIFFLFMIFRWPCLLDGNKKTLQLLLA